jgi:hypothetical protein
MKKKPPLELCRLCGNLAILRNSHILPEFMYQSLYDEKHATIAMGQDPAKDQKIQKGLREFLLCGTCENKLSKWERYGADVLRSLPPTEDTQPGQLVIKAGVDYSKFKLFLMSLIWRMGIATSPSFAEVKLGSHEQKLRDRLILGDPGQPLEYCCAFVAPSGRSDLSQVFQLPKSGVFFDGYRGYICIMLGMFWVFVVSSHSSQMSEYSSFLSRDGNLPINIATESGEIQLRKIGQWLRDRKPVST